MSRDIGQYSNSIRFETEVYDGVYWVPINTLGASRYSGEEMLEISKLPIEERKERIGNLYEAVQLFQISEFRGTLDNKNYMIDGIHWQTHKSPKEAVLSGEGCCATDTNWLAYFIGDKYDRVGSFCYACRDGNGHITTYIEQDNEYYFIDMMMCRKDSQAFLCKENGSLSDLMDLEWAGFLYRCKDPVRFCLFNIERFGAKNRSVPFCFYLRKSGSATATGERTDENGAVFYVPRKDDPMVLYSSGQSGCDISFVDFEEPKE